MLVSGRVIVTVFVFFNHLRWKWLDNEKLNLFCLRTKIAVSTWLITRKWKRKISMRPFLLHNLFFTHWGRPYLRLVVSFSKDLLVHNHHGHTVVTRKVGLDSGCSRFAIFGGILGQVVCRKKWFSIGSNVGFSTSMSENHNAQPDWCVFVFVECIFVCLTFSLPYLWVVDTYHCKWDSPIVKSWLETTFKNTCLLFVNAHWLLHDKKHPHTWRLWLMYDQIDGWNPPGYPPGRLGSAYRSLKSIEIFNAGVASGFTGSS